VLTPPEQGEPVDQTVVAVAQQDADDQVALDVSSRRRDKRRVRYEEFKAAWDEALRESHLPQIGGVGGGEESLDLHSMDRRYKVYVEPIGGQHVEPFHVTATLSWRWSCELTARSATTEEDLLRSLLGDEESDEIETEQPWLRVDLTLKAHAPYGKPLPMPAKSVWAQWVREAMGRLERIEPVIPEENVRETDDGRLAILAWRGEPMAKVVCGADGELKLESIELAAWQAIEVPRQWSASDKEPDEHPHRQLHEMFERVRSALHAWMEVTDHLLPPGPRR